MNPKEFKAEKIKNKHKPKNGGQQVYVLPPNLLQKLGINLGNVGSSHIHPESKQTKSSDLNAPNKKHGNSSSNPLIFEKNNVDNNGSFVNDESSIIKTASLMRESVFLSPTFSNTNLNNVICSTTDQDVEGCSRIINCATKNSKKVETENFIAGSPKHYNISLEHEIVGEHEVNKEVNEKLNNKVGDVSLSIESNDSRLNEKKLSGSSKRSSPIEIKNTINIISEETLTLSKLSELNVLRIPQKHTLIPASLDTIIASNLKKTPKLHSLTSQTSSGQETENKEKHLHNIKDTFINTKIEIPVILKTKCNTQELNEKSDIGVECQFIHESNNASTLCRNKSEVKDIVLSKTSEYEKNVDTEVQEKVSESPNELITKCFGKSNNQVFKNNVDRNMILENDFIKNDCLHNDNLNITTGCNSSISIEKPNHINQDFTNIYIQKQVTDNNDLNLKDDVHVVMHDGDINSKEVRIYEVIQKMDCELSDTTNINNNNIDLNDTSDEIFKTIERSRIEENKLKRMEMLENLKSCTLNVVSTEQNIFTQANDQTTNDVESNYHVEGQEVVFERTNENTIHVTESSKSERISNFITDDEGNSRLSLTLNPKRNNLISKLCIQGVEKPGGINIKEGQNAVLLKTYSNSRKVKHIDKRSFDKNIINEQNQFNHISLNLNETDIFGVASNIQKFCICKDFGMLSYDLYDDIYEHIHYSGHRILDCNSDIIFSIYGDNEMMNYEEYIKNDVTVTDSSEQINDENICWYCADSEPYTLSQDCEIIPKLLEMTQNCSDISETSIKPNTSAIVKIDNMKDKSIGTIVEIPTISTENKKNVASDINVMSSTNANMTLSVVDSNLNNEGNENQNIKNDAKEVILQDVPRKRKISQNHNEVPNSKKITSIINCVICKAELAETLWEDHVANHCLVSLKGSDLDDIDNKSEDLYQKLEQKNKEGTLICLVCGLQSTCVKDFLIHVQECLKLKPHYVSHQNTENTEQLIDKSVTCGVCKDMMESSEWFTHCASIHNYLAWRDGETPLNLDNEDATRDHLQSLVQVLGELVCKTCGLTRKYPKSFMQHIQKCSGSSKPDSSDTSVSGIVECAVCHDKVDNALWVEHIEKEHNYVGWKVNEKPLDITNHKELYNHLSKIIKVLGVLKCSLCGFERKYAKSFALHLMNCTGDKVSDNIPLACVKVEHANAMPEIPKIVICGVCKEEVTSDQWITHIKEKHNYQAWQEGEQPIDFNDNESIRKHLYKILQIYGPLECAKCGISRKYVKLYLQHVETCTGPKDPDESLDSSNFEWDSILDMFCLDDSVKVVDAETTKTVQCGVCDLEMETLQWFDHIRKEHKYMSWRKGRKPLNLSDEKALRQYLHTIVQKLGPLVCAKCGIARKYPKSYMQHVESCMGPNDAVVNGNNTISKPKRSSSFAMTSFNINDSCSDQDSGLVKCDVCKQEVKTGQWIGHIQKQHNYQAWQEGQTPLNLQDVEAVNRHLEEILNAHGQLVCSKCGAAYKHVPLYLEHVDACTGPVEPVDNIVKCGVCQKEMKESVWLKHIEVNHEYIAWKETETPLDVNVYEAIWQHLTNLIKSHGALKCAECGLKRKYAKAYLYHVKDCYGKVYAGVVDENSTMNGSRFSELDTSMDTSCLDDEDKDGSKVVKCGVCSEEIAARKWIDHIQEQHNYLAWKDGDKALDLENEEAIQQHLNSIVQKCVRLTCSKCGRVKRKVAVFYEHIKTCDGTVLSEEEEIAKPKEDVWCTGEIVKCAVCRTEMKDSVWIDHIAHEHEYLAWRDNENPLQVEDEIAVQDHLHKILDYVGELTCGKCGKISKYVRSYLRHRKTCFELAESEDESFKLSTLRGKSEALVKCAQCKREMDGSRWMEHAAKEHNYVAWKESDPPLVLADEIAVKDYFYNLLQQIGELVCSKCGLVRKYAKPFLHHLEGCKNVSWKTLSRSTLKMKKEKGDIVKCAVCNAEMDDTEWLAHIAEHHNYLAWRSRDPAIDINNMDEVRNHLLNIVYEEGYLQCFKCKLRRKHPKKYLEHMTICEGTVQENGATKHSMNGDGVSHSDVDDSDGTEIIKCGVCEQELQRAQWIAHIQKEHKYIAWEAGQQPLDVNDTEAMYNHLHLISLRNNGLMCGACGLVRKYVKSYLQHIKSCSGRETVDGAEMVECGVCGEKMEGNSWRNHAMREHYNIAWILGRTPIDLRKLNEIEKYLKEYYEYKHKMVCRICGLSRSSVAGFYAHILTCGKTDEEVESFKEVCKICNQKYLCIYKTQHYGSHRAQVLAKERKIQAAQKKAEEIKEELESTSGRRKAAEKAISVIEGYAAKLFNDSKCQSCGFKSEHKDELANHVCSKRIENSDENSEDSDVSIKLDDYSEEESDDTDIDSNLSNEEEEAATETPKRIRNDTSGGKYTPKFSKLPSTIRDARSYLQESVVDYLDMVKTNERLFSQWDDCNYEILSEEQLSQYLPTLEESCKVKIGNMDWTSYKKFQAEKGRGYSVLFTGGCIQCISWAPERAGADAVNALCVAAHRAPDCPRLLARDTPRHPALLQMWEFGDFKSKPRLAFGLAHDFGTVWAIDWCPAGARDVLGDGHSDNDKRLRLGLLAMACSNGSAYIVPVPYPDKNQTDNVPFFKIRPCVELRVTRASNKYQATSVNWNMSKGHTTISVGYGDGTTAMYDLVTESPLLRAQEGDLTVLYPFQDERLHNSCVTALTSCATGAWCSASPTGCAGGTGAAGGARPLRAHVTLAATAALFTPLWPSVLLSGDDTIVGNSPNEIEWGCSGRRLGCVRALAGSVRRARVAAVTPPLVQALRPHPVQSQGHKSLYRRTVAMVDMIPLAMKRSRQRSNDELSMKVEPITYKEAVQSYGIEFKMEHNLDKALVSRVQSRPREACPERFPLADVAALAYCPAAAHAARLAIATHAGLVFLVDA